MLEHPEDICPRPAKPPLQTTMPHSPGIYPSTVYQCQSPEQANQLLSGELPGYVYSRDGQPNAEMLAEKCRQLHHAEQVAITSSGMAAMALALLSFVKQGDHLIVSRHLYGCTISLLTDEASRLGIEYSLVDTSDLSATAQCFTDSTKLVVVETITNPILQISDINSLSTLAHDHHALLLVDNSFAGPSVCCPLDLGADLVLESITKVMNGHSDVLLGMLAGRSELWQRVGHVLSAWGLSSTAWDCWLAHRGLSTMAIRVEKACQNAMAVAQFLTQRDEVENVLYPGLDSHPNHSLAAKQFQEKYGTIVTFTLKGGLKAAKQFIATSDEIPFCPSLGEVSTTLSHPQSTSHRGLSDQERSAMGITGGTIRLSVGIESMEYLTQSLKKALS